MKRALYTLTWLIACLAANALPLVARDPLDGENTIELPSTCHFLPYVVVLCIDINMLL